MKKATTSTDGTIAVTVTRMGTDPIAVRVAKDSTVEQVLTAAGVTGASNTQYFVGGLPAQSNDILEDLDVLALVTPKQAGR